MTVPTTVTALTVMSLMWARPKSTIFTRPALVSMMLAGLMSRWTMPPAWASARPSATWQAMSSTSSSGSHGAPAARPASRARSIRALRLSPSQYAIASRIRPSAVSSMSWTVQMLGWSRRDAARASRTNRVFAASSLAIGAARNLSATRRPSRVSSAR
jgi:hypothetical protein